MVIRLFLKFFGLRQEHEILGQSPWQLIPELDGRGSGGSIVGVSMARIGDVG
jgi:hypothetical protein